MGVAALCIGLGLVGITRLETGSNPVRYYKADDPVRVSLEYVDGVLSGTSNLEVLVDSGQPGGVKHPEFLRRMKEVQKLLNSLDEWARRSRCGLRRASPAGHKGGKSAGRNPATRAESPSSCF